MYRFSRLQDPEYLKVATAITLILAHAMSHQLHELPDRSRHLQNASHIYKETYYEPVIIG